VRGPGVWVEFVLACARALCGFDLVRVNSSANDFAFMRAPYAHERAVSCLVFDPARGAGAFMQIGAPGFKKMAGTGIQISSLSLFQRNNRLRARCTYGRVSPFMEPGFGPFSNAHELIFGGRINGRVERAAGPVIPPRERASFISNGQAILIGWNGRTRTQIRPPDRRPDGWGPASRVG